MFTRLQRDHRFTSGRPQPERRQLQLHEGQVRSLPRTSEVFRVLSGHAWLTFDGKDFVLSRGETIRLYPGQDAAVISSVGKRPLVCVVS